jgi:pimeloyl-ACP methyl ester carboxylesterase
MTHPRTTLLALLCLALLGLPARAQLIERRVDIFSEGVRMGGYVLHPAATAGERLPAVVLSHGWGGTAALLRPEAERFARAGYFVLAFDYRGWGESDGRPVRDGGVAFAGHDGAGPCVCGAGAAAGDGAILRASREIEP